MDADQFRYRMGQLSRPETDKKAPHWEYWRMVLYDWILAGDPARFWECPAVYHCMMVNHWPGPAWYEYLQLSEQLSSACRIPHFGPDDGFSRHSSGLSMNLIHQAYHLHQWKTATGQRIDQLDTIVEFGGGYGAMALLCHRLGFEGKYIIYDLPEFSLLQEYYLSQFGLLASVEWNPKEYAKNIDLFIALYSVSEVDPESRYIPTSAKSYLFLYSGQWEKWDNVSYFQVFQPSVSEKVNQWRHVELTHLPDRGNFYSIGYEHQ